MDTGECAIGRTFVVKGHLSASEDVTIAGRFEGTIYAPGHELTIRSTASVKAALNANVVRVDGAVQGSITARETIDIGHTALVQGRLSAPYVAMAPEASRRHQCDDVVAESVGRVGRVDVYHGRVEPRASHYVELPPFFEMLHETHELLEHDWLFGRFWGAGVSRRSSR